MLTNRNTTIQPSKQPTQFCTRDLHIFTSLTKTSFRFSLIMVPLILQKLPNNNQQINAKKILFFEFNSTLIFIVLGTAISRDYLRLYHLFCRSYCKVSENCRRIIIGMKVAGHDDIIEWKFARVATWKRCFFVFIRSTVPTTSDFCYFSSPFSLFFIFQSCFSRCSNGFEGNTNEIFYLRHNTNIAGVHDTQHPPKRRTKRLGKLFSGFYAILAGSCFWSLWSLVVGLGDRIKMNRVSFCVLLVRSSLS